MATKNIIEKFILNGVELYLPDGGGADTNTINALIDGKLGNYDTLFKLESGLYKILNDLDSEDNLGLTSGETRADIVGNATNMSKVSHSRAVMSKVVNSPYAFGLVVNSSNCMKEVSECWNSMTIIANNVDSAISYLTSPYADTYINTAIVQDAFNWDNLIPYLPDSLFTSMYLEDSTKVAEIPTNSVLKKRLNQMSPDDLLPAIFYWTELSGYSTFESLCQDNSAVNTLTSNTNAMIIVNNNIKANEIFDENTYYNISFVSTNAQMLNRAIKDSDWVAYFTSAEHNAELQSQVVNLYNTASSNPSYFTETARTYNRDTYLAGNCTGENKIVLINGGGYNYSSSTYLTHANGVLAGVFGSGGRQPTRIDSGHVNGVSFSNCTFGSNSGRAAIAVYQAI